jgi:hypothetical protein
VFKPPAFLGGSNKKEALLYQTRSLQTHGEFVQGVCKHKRDDDDTLGCTIHGDDHDSYCISTGIPTALLHLQDSIFERLLACDAVLFPEQFLDAIKVDADLSLVWPHFAVFLLTDDEHGMLQYAYKSSDQETLSDVAYLYQQTIDGHHKKQAEWDGVVLAAKEATTAAVCTGRTTTWIATYVAMHAAKAHSSPVSARIAAWTALSAWQHTTWAEEDAILASGYGSWMKTEYPQPAKQSVTEVQRDKLLSLLKEAPVEA